MRSPRRWCLCAPVSAQALEALLEASGRGSYRDDHPWLVALDLLAAARSADEALPILLASSQPARFSHWGLVTDLAVVELHRATWETVVSFGTLAPVHPIWTDLDSVFLKPSGEQLEREAREGIHQHRYPLTQSELHPYAICETPAFIIQAMAGAGESSG